MATPTVEVTVDLATIAGEAIEGVTVRARLDGNEVYEGIVVSKSVSAVTDANGVAVLDLFPNALDPVGLGTQGTTYRFTAAIDGGRSVNVRAVVPNEACRLENILVDAEPVTLSAAELALAQAQTAVTTAATSAAAAELDAIQTAEDRAVVEATKAEMDAFIGDFGDLSDAISSTTAAAASAEAEAAIASAQATIATTQAGLATTAKEGAEAALALTQAAQAATEVASDAALAATLIFVDDTAGLANTSGSGDTNRHYYIPSPVADESLILKRNDAGSATEVKRFPSTTELETVSNVLAGNLEILFAGGGAGFWLSPSDYAATAFEDDAGTTPADVDDSIGLLEDKSGNGNDVLQATSASRPSLRIGANPGKYVLDFDGGDDKIAMATFAGGTLTSDMDCFMVVKRTSPDSFSLGFAPAQGYFGVGLDGGAGAASAGVGSALSYWVDGVEVGDSTTTQGDMHTALTPGEWAIVEVRNLDLSGLINLSITGLTSYFLNGQIGSIVLCPAQSDAVRAAIRSVLRAEIAPPATSFTYYGVKDGLERWVSFDHSDVDTAADNTSPVFLDVLLPDDYNPSLDYPVVYVGQVEPGPDTFGDPLQEIKSLDLHNTHGAIFVTNTWMSMPWYGTKNDNTRRYDVFIRDVVTPFIDAQYSTERSREGRLLLGFSKSGFGAMSMLLRNPLFYGYAAGWDVPWNVTYGQYETAAAFGSSAQFDLYNPKGILTSYLPSVNDKARVVVAGSNLFATDAAAFDALLTANSVAHTYLSSALGAHTWGAGWLTSVVAALMALRD